MKVMIQDELRQTLAGLMPPPTAALASTVAILPVVVAPVVNPPVMVAPPTNNDNARGQPLNTARMYLLWR